MKNREGLIAELNFERFVMGQSNELAYAAAYQIAKQSGYGYNPLIFYGGTGLGKTHLLHSIGNFVRERDGDVRVLCVDAERFVTGLRKALRDEASDAFTLQFESVDILLFDTVQFLAGSRQKKYQAIILQIFDDFLRNQKQIVLTCSCYPKELTGMDSRLLHLFGWGLTVCIEPPDFETRVKILEGRALFLGRSMPKEVVVLIANKVKGNVRELEGIQNTLFAHARYRNKELTMKFVRRILKKQYSNDS